MNLNPFYKGLHFTGLSRIYLHLLTQAEKMLFSVALLLAGSVHDPPQTSRLSPMSGQNFPKCVRNEWLYMDKHGPHRLNPIDFDELLTSLSVY